MSLKSFTKKAVKKVKLAVAREANKYRAGFQAGVDDILNTTDKYLAQPALKARNEAVSGLGKAGSGILFGLRWGTLILVLVAGVVVLFYVAPFLPGRAKS